ncbi:hypothetical protein HDV00_003218 [Rhizophlyctis rosea]|nr:hypothetical protein HDV00_003218 [Rhizophlyctis rosea]
MSGETDYSDWSKKQLIARLKELEKSVVVSASAAKPTDSVSTPQPTSANPDMPPTKSQASKGPRKPRPFDFSLHAARPIALKIAYLGWDYFGLASQEGDTVETIESVVYRALLTAKLIPDRRTCAWSRCGRTDKGVSSFGQVVALKVRSTRKKGAEGTVEWGPKPAYVSRGGEGAAALDDGDDEPSHPAETKAPELQVSNPEPMTIDPPHDPTPHPTELPYISILNRMLPPEIRILAWSPVPPDFDARFDCTYRRYKYFFPTDNLNIPAMREAARYLVGKHDFRNFCKIDMQKKVQTYEREVIEADISPMGMEDGGGKADSDASSVSHAVADSFDPSMSFHVFTIKGRAFLWHQVRCMVAILFLVGRGLESPTIVKDLLDMSKHPPDAGRPTYEMASEFPLVLVECGYPDGTFDWRAADDGGSEEEGVAKIYGRVKDLWKDHAIKEVQLRSLLGDIRRGAGQAFDGALVPNVVGTKGGEENRGTRYVRIMDRPRADSLETRKMKGAETNAMKKRVGDGNAEASGEGNKKVKTGK